MPLFRGQEMVKAVLMLLGIRDRKEEPSAQDNGCPVADGKGRLPGLNLPQERAWTFSCRHQ